jgi:hypothetical protein
MNRRNHAVSLLQAAQASPMLANLAELARDSQERLRTVQPLIPANLLPSIVAGPIEGDAWCLLVSNTTAAAKLRQLLPSLVSTLNSRGWTVTSIRVKVQAQGTR